MKDRKQNTSYRILVIDDSPAIHEDFRKILRSVRDSNVKLDKAEDALFGESKPFEKHCEFEVDSAHQGEEGVKMVCQAIQDKRPYAMAFVDVRMPPGWDGIEVTARLWGTDEDLQIVICTAYSDYSWEEMFARLGTSDRMFVLKKPFDRAEVLQLAHGLAEKRRLLQENRLKHQHLESAMEERAAALEKVSEKLQAEIAELKKASKEAD
jgi:CheY-like chemotaxis protein